MQLTRKQQEGLNTIIRKYRAGERYAVIGGFAGSGKSTLVKFVVEALAGCGINPGTDVAYCAFTGKAAQVLIDKGNPNATTAHKLLYKTVPLSSGKFKHTPKLFLEYKIVICDECSMLPKKMADTLLAHRETFVIFVGDPGQLPPISKDDDNHLLDHPDVFLDEIMRQAQDSGIIRLSMLIREGRSLDGFKADDAMVIPQYQLNTGMLEWADQIICATNATRRNLNNQCRELRGFTKPIEFGEKLISLKNEWNIISDKENALTNGCIGTLDSFCDTYVSYPARFCVPSNKLEIIHGNFITDTGDKFMELDIDKNCLITGEPKLTSKQKYTIGRDKRYQGTIPAEFTYGYAITCHKSQGSEFPKVLSVEEKFPFEKEEHKRWLYTAVTRGSQRSVLVRS